MGRHALPIFIAIITLSVSIADGRERLRVVVNDLDANGVTEQIARVVSDHLRVKLIETRRFIIPEREKMEAVLSEQAVGLQLGECFSHECAVEIGRLLQANKMIVGTVSLLNRTYNISIRFIDLETGAAEFSADEKVQSIDDLYLAAERLAARIAAFIPPRGSVTAVSGEDIIIDLGTSDGITTGMPFRIMRRVERVPGFPEEELVATVRTVSVQETWSRAAYQVEPGLMTRRPAIGVGDVAIGPQTVVVTELPQYAFLTVYSRPIGAEVYVDNLFRGRTTDTGLEVRLTAGEHRVRLAAPAHHAEERVIELQPNQRTSFNATLEPVLPRRPFIMQLAHVSYVLQNPTDAAFRSEIEAESLHGVRVGFGRIHSIWTSEIGGSWTTTKNAPGRGYDISDVQRLGAHGQIGFALRLGWIVPYGAIGYEIAQFRFSEQGANRGLGAGGNLRDDGWYWTTGVYVHRWLQISYRATTGRDNTDLRTYGIGVNITEIGK